MRWFRIAAATGDVQIRGQDLAGTVIANAVRLETAGEAGHFLVDIATFEALSEQHKEHYLPEEEIKGKRDELIPARRRVFLSDASPRPDHVRLTLNLQRSEFNDLAGQALVRDIARALGVESSAITLEGIRPGSVEVTLRFKDSQSLAKFINGHIRGDAALRTFFAEWSVQNVTYHASLSSHSASSSFVEPDLAPARGVVEPALVAASADAAISPENLLALLNGLPPAWFEQLIFKFDAKNAVPAASAAQSVRAMELIKVLRLTDPDFSNVKAKINELKQGNS